MVKAWDRWDTCGIHQICAKRTAQGNCSISKRDCRNRERSTGTSSGNVFTQIVPRHVKQALKSARINSLLFTAGSTRDYNSSKRFMKELSLTDIMKKWLWKSTSTFKKFYNLLILNNWINAVFFGKYTTKYYRISITALD